MGDIVLLKDIIEEKEGLLLDVEGTLITKVEGGEPYLDAEEFLFKVRGMPIILITNLARRSSKHLSSVLRRMGLDFSPEEIINPTKAAAGRILDVEFEKPVRVFLISEGGHLEDLSEYDWIEFVREEPVDAVLLGASRDITYQQLNFAFRVILKGATLIVLGGDLWAEGSQFGDVGPYLMEGAFARALEAAANISARYVGKPNKEIFEEALSRLRISRERVVLIGDSIYSDIIGAYRAQIDAILIDREGIKRNKLLEYLKREDTYQSNIYITRSLRLESVLERVV